MEILNFSERKENEFKQLVTVAGVIAFLFAIYLFILNIFAEPSLEQWGWGDPILEILSRPVTLWGVSLLSVLVLLAWAFTTPVTNKFVKQGLKEAMLGVGLTIAFTTVLRLVIGPEFPDFIPPEESSRSGFILGMSAGLAEEVLFHLTLMPLVFLALNKILPYHAAVIISVLVAAIGFVLLHEYGEMDGFIDKGNVAARFMIPGMLMGLLFFYRSPPFVVALHCSAHIMIPIYF